jgi:hypothetical protein
MEKMTEAVGAKDKNPDLAQLKGPEIFVRILNNFKIYFKKLQVNHLL